MAVRRESCIVLCEFAALDRVACPGLDCDGVEDVGAIFLLLLGVLSASDSCL